MNHSSEKDTRLWDYIDGSSGPEEKAAIRELIRTDSDWQLRYQELLDMDQELRSITAEQPSMRFSKNVMEAIAGNNKIPAITSYVNKWVLRSGAGILVAMFLVAIVTIFKSPASQSAHSGELFNNLHPYLNKVPSLWYYFTIANMIGLLVLLDAMLRNKWRQGKRTAS